MAAIDDLKAALGKLGPAASVSVQAGAQTIRLTVGELLKGLGVLVIDPIDKEKTKNVRVVTPFLRLRAQPTINSAEVGRFNQGDIIEVRDVTGVSAEGFTWLPTADGRGWIASDYTNPAEVGKVWSLPFTANQRGVGTSAGGWAPSAKELELIRRNRIEFALICAYQPGQAAAAIPDLRAAGVRNFIVRAALNPPISPDPRNFVDRTLPILREYALAIGPNEPLIIAVHNEPNLTNEGWGTAWADGAAFSRWYLAVVDLYRRALPNCKIGFPAMSPGGDVNGIRMDESRFIAGCPDALAASDWVGVHHYWIDPAGSDCNPPIARWRAWFGNMSLVGTEVGPSDSCQITSTAMNVAYQKFAQVGVPMCGWVLEGAGAWVNASWVIHDLAL